MCCACCEKRWQCKLSQCALLEATNTEVDCIPQPTKFGTECPPFAGPPCKAWAVILLWQPELSQLGSGLLSMVLVGGRKVKLLIVC